MYRINILFITLFCSIVLLSTQIDSIQQTTATALTESQTGFDCANVTEIPQIECEALVAIYHSTDGDNWDHNFGWLTTNEPCSTWLGIGCTDSHVTGIDFFRCDPFGS